jgi:hypothetical protein
MSCWSRRIREFTWVSLLGFFVGGSCSAPEPVEVPAWIDNPPTTDRHIYATGTYWGSLNPADNEKNAVLDGQKNLGRALQSQVDSVTKIKDRGSDRVGQSDSTVSSKVTVANMELIATWRDVDGVRGPRSCVWVLVRTEKPKG